MKKAIIRMLHMVGSAVTILAALYTGLSVYYRDCFSYGTWVNGIYCTGKEVQEVNTELMEKAQYTEIVFILPNGAQESVSLEEVGYVPDFCQPLLRVKAAQNPWLWWEGLLSEGREQRIAPEGSLDEEKFTAVFDGLDFVRERKDDKSCQVAIRKTENGYTLVNERHQALLYDVCKETVRNAILRGDAVCDLQKEGCYGDLPLTEEMQSTLRLWERIEEFQDCGIVYRFGEKTEKISPAIVSDWMVVEDGRFLEDGAGHFLVDREKMDAYVDALADQYDTVGCQRQFTTTQGDVVCIDGGTYGNLIDREAEKEYLYQAFTEGQREVHEPSYLQEAKEKGLDDIGDTYIEVDMGRQHMYYYEDGELVVDAPVVTGDMMRRRDTPAMVCYVNEKQKNRVLRGPGYASPVKYWMPIKGGIGIHDARWRSEFGGDIYKTSGSHGCINTPEEEMARLYECAEVGTPVVLFY